jgi:hypothetical protein
MRTTRVHMPLALVLAALPVAAVAQVQDHLTCFAVKDRVARTKYQVTVTTDAGSQACIVKTPAKIACVQAAKTDVSPTPPGGGPSGSAAGSFLCYKAKCARPSGGSNVSDQFGQRAITFRGSRFVCAPANLNAPAPASTSTTTPSGQTTTTTLGNNQGECRFEDGQCRGSCGGTGRCRAAVGGDACECRDVPCGQADSPECDGGCSNPDEACIFDLSGCSCVDIP